MSAPTAPLVARGHVPAPDEAADAAADAAMPPSAGSRWSARGRRRRRSVRALTAASLLVLAGTLVAVASVGAFDRVWVAGAGGAAVLLGALATRIVWSEVRLTRREASFDRARQTEAFAAESARRSDEHAALAMRLGSRLRQAEGSVEDLRTRLAGSSRRQALAESEAKRLRERLGAMQGTHLPEQRSQQTRAAGAEAGDAVLRDELARVREALADARRAALSYRQQTETLQAEIALLQDALVERRAEDADELASWQGVDRDEREGVVRMAAWSDRRHA